MSTAPISEQAERPYEAVTVVELDDPYGRSYVVQHRSIPARVHHSVTPGWRWRTAAAVDKHIQYFYHSRLVFTSIDMERTRPVGIQRHVERGHLHLASPKIENSSHSSHAKPQSCWQHRIASDSSQQLSNTCGSFHSIDSPLCTYTLPLQQFLLSPRTLH